MVYGDVLPKKSKSNKGHKGTTPKFYSFSRVEHRRMNRSINKIEERIRRCAKTIKINNKKENIDERD